MAGTVAWLRCLGPFGGPFCRPKLFVDYNFRYHFSFTCWTTFGTHFGAHSGSYFGAKSAQEEGKMSPRGQLRDSKTQQTCFSQNVWTNNSFKMFLESRGTQRAPKPYTKVIQKLILTLTLFLIHSGPKNCSKMGPQTKPLLGAPGATSHG